MERFNHVLHARSRALQRTKTKATRPDGANGKEGFDAPFAGIKPEDHHESGWEKLQVASNYKRSCADLSPEVPRV